MLSNVQRRKLESSYTLWHRIMQHTLSYLVYDTP